MHTILSTIFIHIISVLTEKRGFIERTHKLPATKKEIMIQKLFRRFAQKTKINKIRFQEWPVIDYRI
jgi:hypothetical protein